MTNEEIEAAREALESMLGTACSSGYATESDRDDAQARLDALCAAAREPESLVGRRVKYPAGVRGKISSGPFKAVEVEYRENGVDLTENVRLSALDLSEDDDA